MAVLKKILTERGEVARIAKLYSVSGQTVRNALRYITEGETSDAIRKEAIDAGGVVITRKIKERV